MNNGRSVDKGERQALSEPITVMALSRHSDYPGLYMLYVTADRRKGKETNMHVSGVPHNMYDVYNM